MTIPYPQICPDSRSFAPAGYATTQPVYLEYVESGRQWSAVPFGSELQLGYEDLTEADAALFTDAYEDSRSGFHVLDIGTEPAGGIGDMGLAARITATTWKFAEPPVVEAKGNGLYRVSVKLTSELPAFVDVAVAGISVPGAEVALSWLDTGVTGQPICSGPLTPGGGGGNGGPALFLVIGDPYFNLGVTDPAVQNTPTLNLLGSQGLIFASDVSPDPDTTVPGFIVRTGGWTSRDNEAGDNDREPYSDYAAFDFEGNLQWRLSSQGYYLIVSLYAPFSARLCSKFPGGDIGYVCESRGLGGPDASEIELLKSTTTGQSPQRYAYRLAPSRVCCDITYGEASQKLYLGFSDIVAAVNSDMSPSWATAIVLPAPWDNIRSIGLAVSNSGSGDKIWMAGHARNSSLGSGNEQSRPILHLLDSDGSLLLGGYYSDATAGRPTADFGLRITGVAIRPDGNLAVSGIGTRSFAPSYGDSALFVATIDPTDGSVVSAKMVKIASGYGDALSVYNTGIAADTDGTLYVIATSYFSSPLINPSTNESVTLYHLSSSLELISATDIVANLDGASSGIYVDGPPYVSSTRVGITAGTDRPWGTAVASPGLRPNDGLVILFNKSSLGAASTGVLGSVEYESGGQFTVRDLTPILSMQPYSLSFTSLATTSASRDWESVTSITPANVKDPGYATLSKIGDTPALEPSLPGAVTYSQSSVYVDNTPATFAGMNDGSYNTGSETGTDGGVPTWIQMDLGAEYLVSSVTIGCDYDSALPGGWGPTYTENCDVTISEDGVSWTTLFNTGTFSAPIQTYSVLAAGRYIRINSISANFNFVAVTEFKATYA